MIFRAFVVTAAVITGVGTIVQIVHFVSGDGHLHGLVHLFDFDGEANIPAYYSALLLLYFTFVLRNLARLDEPIRKRAWNLLAAGTLFLSVDEAVAIHERMLNQLEHMLRHRHAGHTHLIIGTGLALAGIVVVSWLFRWGKGLSAHPRRILFAGALIYVGGAYGLDTVGAWYKGRIGPDALYVTVTTIEESLETAGMLFALFAFLLLLEEARARINSSPATSS
jgi:hypothetical protein